MLLGAPRPAQARQLLRWVAAAGARAQAGAGARAAAPTPLVAGSAAAPTAPLQLARHALASSYSTDTQAPQPQPREQMPFDLLIVGAGPAGLAAGIRFAQLCRQHDRPFSAAVIDKGAEVGAHILSGCVLEPRAMDELFPEWREKTGQTLLTKKAVVSSDPSIMAAQRKNDEDAAAVEAANAPLAEHQLWPELPLRQLVTQDRFLFLTESGKSLRMPCPPQMKSRGKGYVVSLSQLCRWLGRAAEALGVEVLPGFAGKELLFSWDGAVAGVATGDWGLDKSGKPIAGKFTPGVDLLARVTLLAEGARGSLTAEAEAAFGLRAPGDDGEGGGPAASGAAWGARPVGGDELEEAREAARRRARALPPPPAPKPQKGARRGPTPLSPEEAAVPPATTLAGGGRCGQTYALGIKEVWEIDPARHVPGTVWHTIGFPLPSDVYGGGFVYHMGPEPDEEGFGSEEEREAKEKATAAGDDGDEAAATTTTTASTPKVPRRCRVALGLVVGLDYADPHLSPYGEFQRFKRHPSVRELLQGGKCVSYGARVLNEGGLQSLPGLIFPGGALIGCSAGFLNVPKIKGTHTAMKSGILAAEEAFRALCEADDKASKAAQAGATQAADAAAASAASSTNPAPAPPKPILLDAYPSRLDASWVAEELRAARNIRPGFKWGLLPGLVNAAVSTYFFRGREPWTLLHARNGGSDNAALKERLASEAPPAEYDPEKRYPKPDGEVAFDLPTSLFRSGTNHDHHQPCHLLLTRGEEEMRRWNYERYAKGPESRYCPAGVYDWGEREEEGGEEKEGEGGGGRGGGAGRGKGKAVPRLTINAQNCLHCKACDVKDVKRNIRWTPPEGGGGPAYTIM